MFERFVCFGVFVVLLCLVVCFVFVYFCSRVWWYGGFVFVSKKNVYNIMLFRWIFWLRLFLLFVSFLCVFCLFVVFLLVGVCLVVLCVTGVVFVGGLLCFLLFWCIIFMCCGCVWYSFVLMLVFVIVLSCWSSVFYVVFVLFGYVVLFYFSLVYLVAGNVVVIINQKVFSLKYCFVE